MERIEVVFVAWKNSASLVCYQMGARSGHSSFSGYKRQMKTQNDIAICHASAGSAGCGSSALQFCLKHMLCSIRSRRADSIPDKAIRLVSVFAADYISRL